MEETSLSGLNLDKGGGLVAVVVQDASTGEVLMLAYADREALERTLKEGLAYFYSRSRKKLWLKGETSGNLLKVVKVVADCDGDAVIYLVEPKGPVCHRGTKSCFTRVVRDTGI